jgi:hypothetical protein
MDHDDDDFYDAPYEVASFDIDTPVDTIQAYASKFSPRLGSHGMNDRVRMSKDKWLSLDQKTKDLWDQIDDKYKSIILGYAKSSSPSPSSNRPPSKLPYSNQRHHSNLHDMSAYDFL